MSEPKLKPIRIKNLNEEKDEEKDEKELFVCKITNDYMLKDLTNSILKFAGCSSLDEIELKTCKGVETGLSLLYLLNDEDLPINIVHLKASEKNYQFNNEFHFNGQIQKSYCEKKASRLKRYLATKDNACFTIVSKNLLCTYAHHSHLYPPKPKEGAQENQEELTPDLWKVGSIIKDIRLFDGEFIDCVVEQRNNRLDCVWLRPTKEISFAEELCIESPFASQEAIVLGLSGVHQIDDMSYSYDICKVACACIDHNGHFKTNKKSAPGESGAPIFDLYTGSLLGMMTGSEAYREKKTGCNQSMPNNQETINEVKSQHISKELFAGLFDKVNAAGYGGKGCFVPSLYLKRDMYI